jgi:hypothetical protein
MRRRGGGKDVLEGSDVAQLLPNGVSGEERWGMKGGGEVEVTEEQVESALILLLFAAAIG